MVTKRMKPTLLMTLEGLFCLSLLLCIPTDPKTAWLFGFSTSRLALAAGFIVASLTSLFIFISQQNNTGLGNYVSRFMDTQIHRRTLAAAIAPLSIGCILYFVAWLGFYPRYTAYFLRGSPVVLFLMFGCAHGIFALWSYKPELWSWLANLGLSAQQLNHKFNLTALFIILLFIMGGVHFYRTANYHAQFVNHYPEYSDQQAYLHIAEKAYATRFQYKGDRQKNPGFPYLLALIYDPGMNEFKFFRRAQMVNIFLSMIVLVIFFIFTRKFLPTMQSLLLTLVAAGSIYVYRAGYVQPEPLYFFLAFVTYVLMAWMIVNPSLLLAATTGVMVALAYLVKASALPSMMLFVLMFGAKILCDWISRTPKKEKGGKILTLTRSNLVKLILMITVFLGLLSPYLLENKRMFGQYFYNVNTSLFIWYDSFNEARETTSPHGDYIGWPAMPEEQIHTMRKYLREHTAEQIINREITGLVDALASFKKPYSRFNYPIIFSIVFCLVCAWDFRKSFELARRHVFLVIFALGYFTGYMLSFAWFSPIADHFVARFVYGLMLPFSFSVIYATNKIAEGSQEVKLLGKSLCLTDLLLLIHMAVFILILYDFSFFAPIRLSDPERWYAK